MKNKLSFLTALICLVLLWGLLLPAVPTASTEDRMVQFEDELRSSFQLLEKKIQVQIEDYGAASARQSRHITEQDAQLEVIKKELNVIRDNLKTDSSEFKNELRQFALDEREKVEKGGEKTSKYLSAYSAVLAVIATIVATIPAILSYMTSKTFEATSKIRLEEIQIAGQNKLNEINKLLQEGKSKVSQLETLVDENTKTFLQNTNKDNKESFFSKETVEAAHKSQETGVGRDVLLGAAILAQDQKKWSQAYELWNNLFNQDPKNIVVLLSLAVVCHEWGNVTEDNKIRNQLYDKADSLYQKIISEYPNNYAVISNIASLQFSRARYILDKKRKIEILSKVEDIYEKLLEIVSNDSTILSNYGNVIYEKYKAMGEECVLKNFSKIQNVFEKSLEIKNENVNVIINYAKILSYVSNFIDGEQKSILIDKAENLLHSAISIDATDSDAYEALANLKSRQALECEEEEKQKLFAEAESLYKKAIKYAQCDIFIKANLYTLKCLKLISAPFEKLKPVLDEREKILLRLKEMNPEFALYDLACVAAIRGKGEDALNLLRECQKKSILPSLAHLQKDIELNSLRNKPEFQDFLKQAFPNKNT